MGLNESYQAVRTAVQTWTQPPQKHANPGDAIHHLHYPFVRAALELDPPIPWPVMELDGGESLLSFALYGLWEQEAIKGFAAGPGWQHVTQRGWRPAAYWAKNVRAWEERGTEQLDHVESRFACPGVVLPNEIPPPWFDIRDTAPTRAELWAVWREKLRPESFVFLAATLPGEEELPPEPEEPEEPEGPVPSETQMVFHKRFAVTVRWHASDGTSGNGKVTADIVNDSGLFYFFEPSNREMLVKVLDRRQFGQGWWFFGACATDLGFIITVTDTKTGSERLYMNEPGHAAEAIHDTSAFPEGP